MACASTISASIGEDEQLPSDALQDSCRIFISIFLFFCRQNRRVVVTTFPGAKVSPQSGGSGHKTPAANTSTGGSRNSICAIFCANGWRSGRETKSRELRFSSRWFLCKWTEERQSVKGFSWFRTGDRTGRGRRHLDARMIIQKSFADTGWAELHTLPCTETPWPDIQCEAAAGDTDRLHGASIDVGPDVASFPPCKSSATQNSLPLQPFPLPQLRLPPALSLHQLLLIRTARPPLQHRTLRQNPSSISNLTRLRVLCLSQNAFHGVILPEFGRLLSLQELDLSHNHLSGQMPEEIGSLLKLGIIDLSSNKLQGTIPASLSTLHSLQKLDLSFNSLCGTVPPELGELKRLESFGAMREEEEEELRLGLSLKKESVDHVKCVRMISANFLQLLELWAECLCASAAMFLLCLCLRHIGKLNLNSQERNLNSWR
ncbi:hypothetical protein KSP39_PZI022107 [Platanthera zijinensis]|uniref:Uncharacterized protein n=1 Tax=Platanthera zijinensis TaxID=2320716 RepID=A0AAP0AYE4_9ASPA